jgi:hypothetical protein
MSLGRLLLALATLVVLGLAAIPLVFAFRESERRGKRVAAGAACFILVGSIVGAGVWALRPVTPGAMVFRGTFYCGGSFCEGDNGSLGPHCASQGDLAADAPLRSVGRVSWMSLGGVGHVSGLPLGGHSVYGTARTSTGSNDPAMLYVRARSNCFVGFFGPLG